MTTTSPPVLPFGQHKDVPLDDIPRSYLSGLMRQAKLAGGLRAAVADERCRRGIEPPPAPAPLPLPRCWRSRQPSAPDYQAKILLEQGIKVRDQVDIAQRIAALEKLAQQRNDQR
jgi:hypothetical protein